MMKAVLTTTGLTKHFGRIQAVKGIDLRVEAGTIYGMLGPNGSGKTTTLGMLLGTIRPTAGSYTWQGDGTAEDIRKNIGAILEGPIFYPYMSAAKNLEITCLIKQVPFSRIDEVLKYVRLHGRRNDVFKTFSLGMKQRLAIASALLTNPAVMILDEPTNGLDPEGIADIRELILEIADSGKTIVLASHLLDEVQKVCSDFCVLRSGTLIYQGSVKDALGQQATVVIDADDRAALVEALGQASLVSSASREGLELKLPEDWSPQRVNAYCFEQGITLSQLRVVQRSLEAQFLHILKAHDAQSTVD